ncbi:MAG: Eco57I restriction-modification methylase domain-containing protein [Labilibaculum sp.]|nr:Eco57I restriction-modification methylase domain-containing protein [Labilibaculum sp.]
MALFQTSVLKNYLQLQDPNALNKAYKKYSRYFHNKSIQQNIRESKEEQFQEGFLRELFVTVLDYTLNPQVNFNLTTELKNEKGAKKADGAILKNDQALAVIELKGTKTKDLESIRQQAFDYKANHSACVYVITSNFEKLRFYINNAVDYQEFNLFTLTQEEFALLYLCLHKDNLLANLPLTIKTASVVEEEKITKNFYKDYSLFKRELYRDLVKENMKNEVFRNELQKEDNERAIKNIKLSLFQKSQKLIDRFLFIFFAEDRALLPPNSVLEILKQWDKLNDLDEEVPLYNRYKKYFQYLDTGRQGTTKKAEIYAYNGGLFKADAVLDSLIINNELLYKHTKTLSKYNFESQVDVNILGHIFENSLNEIESINAEIEGSDFDKQKTKRKKDGVFYTPKYITKYIVDNTIGKLCNEKKDELGINNIDFEKNYILKKARSFELKKEVQTGRGKQVVTEKKKTNVSQEGSNHLEKLDAYRNYLLSISILDPACGSGAFLNQAIDFLIKEHQHIDELQASIQKRPMALQDIENTILEKNIYGVDLNQESVEIAKLSLWLRTAQPRRKLTTLNNNIKCGNSLIDSKAVAGDKAFNWQKEFPTIFTDKKKKVFHITTATHDSRTSQRMIDHQVRLKRDSGTRPKAEGIWLEANDELLVTKSVADVVKADSLNVLAYNICGDHMHLLLACEEEEITKIVGKLKAVSAKEYNIAKGITIPNAQEHATKEHATHAQTRGHVPLHRKKYNSLWTQKFHCKPIEDDEQLHNTLEYIQNNRSKHELPRHGKELNSYAKKMCCTYAHAMRAEHKGGFDVVIGNPPYVRQELLSEIKPFLEKNYLIFEGTSDLFAYFYEKSFTLLKKKGIFGFISNTFDKTKAAKKLRNYLTANTTIVNYIDFTEVQIFEGATTYPIILITRNQKSDNNQFSYIKVDKKQQSKIIDIDCENSITVTQDSLEADSWNFNSAVSSKLLTELKKLKPIREQYGKCYYGIKTGLNDAFIINDSQPLSEHVKSIYEGKEIKKWNTPLANQKLILFESKWTKSTYNSEIQEANAFKSIKNDFPELINHLATFEEKAKKRYDKGDFWWELRNCAYYDLFDKPKIIFPNLQNTNKFCLDPKGVFINAPAVFLPINSKTLLCILNSKITWFFLKSICVIRSGGYIEVKPQYFEQIPIPELKNEETFEQLADSIIENTAKSQNVQSSFTTYLHSQFGFEAMSKKLQSWHKLSFAEFIVELNKAIKKENKLRANTNPIPVLCKLSEMDWMEVFEAKKAEAQALQAEIDKTDREIDQMVYELYGLNQEEIKIVEQA